MRIIGGSARRRVIVAPRGYVCRPVTERVRGAIFNILGAELAGAAVLDLFAGSGSLGLEALSRGAASCVFVEGRSDALHAIERNISALGFAGRGRIVRGDALRVSTRRLGGPFDIIFIDPPYAVAHRLDEESAIAGCLCNVFSEAVMRPTGVTVLRLPRRAGEPWLPTAATIADARRYGDDVVRFLRYRTPDAEQSNIEP